MNKTDNQQEMSVREGFLILSQTEAFKSKFPMLSSYAKAVKPMNRPLLGRDKQLHQLRTGLERPELCNILLLGDAGVGKTAIVQGAMLRDENRLYLEIDLATMIGDLNDPNEMANRLKMLFGEAEAFYKESSTGIVLFMDEFHLVTMLSTAAVEALKPMLADSGTRGIRVIAATTFTEFTEHISANQPLVQRLQRVNVTPPSKDATVSILQSFAKEYKVDKYIRGTYLYEQIVELSNKYIPANSQPRKSILLLDQMVGWFKVAQADNKSDEVAFDIALLHTVLSNSEGIQLSVDVDALSIKSRLDAKVFNQKLATSAVATRLQLCTANLHNKSRPAGSFIFCGATGVGKTALAKQLGEIMFNDPKCLIRFDMTEFCVETSFERFRAELTARVWERPHSVILFDEIEKAHGCITRLLLQVLDDGRLIDRNNREVGFLNTYIVITTNAGNEIYKTLAEYANAPGMSDEDQIQELRKHMKVIRRSIIEGTGENKFPPELLGRVDAICPFMPLNEDTQRKILQRRMDSFADEVKKLHGIEVRYETENVLTYLLYDKLDIQADSGGARVVATQFEEEVVTAVATFINAAGGKYSRIKVGVRGEMMIENKYSKESKAYITISPISVGG